MLYLVATPIGNLSDITYRAVQILQNSDYILCEDTRHSSFLLKHYEIKKPLKSYHKFNTASQEEAIIQDLKQGLTISCISDAGTPGICDPGHELVLRCQKENIPVSVIPGPCAAIAALTLSGFDLELFQFVGFLPKKTQELKKYLIELLHYPGTTVCYETPHRLIETLEQIKTLAPERKLSVVRELTKLFEEVKQGAAEELLSHFHNHPPKGEIVLLFSGKTEESSPLSPREEVELLQKQYNLSLKDAIKMAASLRGVPKREIYQLIHSDQEDPSQDLLE